MVDGSSEQVIANGKRYGRPLGCHAGHGITT